MAKINTQRNREKCPRDSDKPNKITERIFYLVKNKIKKTLRNSLDAGNFFLNALQSYSVVKHIQWIDLNNFNVLEVCSVQLYYL